MAHLRIARSRMDVCFRWDSGHTADITGMAEFDPSATQVGPLKDPLPRSFIDLSVLRANAFSRGQDQSGHLPGIKIDEPSPCQPGVDAPPRRSNARPDH
jgi:hypothetical protein